MSTTQQRVCSPIPARASAASQGAVTHKITTEAPGNVKALAKKEQPWRTWFVLGALIVVGSVAVWTWWVVPTSDNLFAQWHYGDAHMTRLTADLGQGREDFVAYDQNGHVVVLEVNHAHPERTHLYTGMSIVNDEHGNTIITLSLADVNHNGRLDVIVTVQEQRYVLFNHGSSFSWSEK